MTSTQVTRLHISPLTPDLLSATLGSRLLEVAQGISYHQIQTFPDQPYGYIDLPVMEAEKIKKKLSGAILKGKKIKVEDARPKKRKHAYVENENPVDEASELLSGRKLKKSTKVSKSQALQGHELSPGRKIKRGWTEHKSSSKNAKDKKEHNTAAQPPSKYTDKEELLFRTKLPDNKADMGSSKTRKSQKINPSQTVHEFEKATARPSFLRIDAPTALASGLGYVDGQGWVDGNGVVVEMEPTNLRARRKATRATAAGQQNKTSNMGESAISTLNEVSIKDDESSTGEEASLSKDSSLSSSPTPQPSQTQASSDDEQPHPLEALFKKPQKPASSEDVAKPSLEVHTSFSFFGGLPNDDIEEEPTMPETPFSSQDTRSRGLRSAAPTPDTAHPSRFNSYGSTGLPGDEELDSSDEDDGQDDQGVDGTNKPPRIKTTSLDPQQSDFAKMFWEKRGDNNRAWKARRRAVLKENRQRENRARRPKNW